MNFIYRDIAFTAVILWAMAGISVKHADIPAVAIPTWIAFGLVGVTLMAAFLVRKPARSLERAS
jgi:hypothetical protein